MSVHVLLNLLNELWKRDKMRDLLRVLSLKSLINSINSSYAQSDQSLCLSLENSMSFKLLTEHHLMFLS